MVHSRSCRHGLARGAAVGLLTATLAAGACEDMVEYNGEDRLFPDLVGARVSVTVHYTEKSLFSECNAMMLHGCALLNVTTSECEIHVLNTSYHEAVTHETNHCRGWDHERMVIHSMNRTSSDEFKRLRWCPFPEVLEAIKKAPTER